LNQLLDICVNRCLGGEWNSDFEVVNVMGDGNVDNSRSSDNPGAPMPHREHDNPILRSMGIKQILPFDQFSNAFLVSHTSRNQQVVHNILGVFFTTAVIWFIRNANSWWKLNRYTTSLQSLLDEESEVNASTAAPKHHKHGNSNGKKLKSQKKSRRRKNHRSFAKNQSPNAHTTHDSASLRETEDETQWSSKSRRPPEDDSDSDDSFHRIYNVHGTRRHHSSNTDPISDQASKGTNSTSSFTTADSCQTHLLSEIYNEGTGTFKHNWNRNSNSSRDLKVSLGYASSTRISSSPQSCKPNTPISKLKDSQNTGCRGNGKWSGLNTANSPVPTAAQREEASRKLREYQMAQLQRLMELRRQREQSGSKSSNSDGGKRMSMRDVVVGTPSVKKILSPPPGMQAQRTKNDCGPKSHHLHVPELLSEPIVKEEDEMDLMLSNILDEDEDNSGNNESINHVRLCDLDRIPEKHHNQNRSVALGDLLLGSLGTDTTNRNKTSPTQVAPNPWQSPTLTVGNIPSNSSVSEQLQQQGEVPHQGNTDANIMLQVSATEFMPSWGDNNAANTRIW